MDRSFKLGRSWEASLDVICSYELLQPVETSKKKERMLDVYSQMRMPSPSRANSQMCAAYLYLYLRGNPTGKPFGKKKVSPVTALQHTNAFLFWNHVHLLYYKSLPGLLDSQQSIFGFAEIWHLTKNCCSAKN